MTETEKYYEDVLEEMKAWDQYKKDLENQAWDNYREMVFEASMRRKNR